MESVGVLLKEEWEFNSLSKMFSGDDEREADCMLHFLQNFGTPSDFLATGEATHGNVAFYEEDPHFYSSENPNPNYYLSENITDGSISASNYNSTSVCNFPNQFTSFNYLTPATMNEMIPHDPINLVRHEQDYNSKQEIVGNVEGNSTIDLVRKRKSEEPQQSDEAVRDNANPKKKSRVPRNTQKSKKNSQAQKNHQLVQINKNIDEESPSMLISSGSSCISEDDSNGSQEPNGGSDMKESSALNSSGKARAGRGAATDPQSLYARKRRERINERLRTLQHLVPNGTKVDISTMLEEAVQYVKFLQLQIKLLSSDETWMYAPIAYNGMDMGLYQNISP